MARDGAEALKYFEGVSPLSSDMEDETETIVLLDISIPKIDGFEVCRCLRARKTDRPPYIIMVTAQDAKETIVEGLEAGADDYIAQTV